jgi:hypothetical protein
MSRARFVFVLLLACGAPLAQEPLRAAAATPDEVRQQLAAQALSPPPLFPMVLPARLATAEAELTVDLGNFQVNFDLGGSYGYVNFDRDGVATLNDLLHAVRRRGFRPRKVTVGHRRVFDLCAHNCGYVWREGGRTYSIGGIYYVGDRRGRHVLADMRSAIKALQPLLP